MMSDIVELQNILRASVQREEQAAELLSRVQPETEARVKRLPVLGREMEDRLSTAESATTHPRTRKLVSGLKISATDRAQSILDLSAAATQADELLKQAVDTRTKQLGLLLNLSIDANLDRTRLESKGIALLTIQIMNQHLSLGASLRGLAIADLIETYFNALSSYLDYPPIEQRARKAIVELTKSIGKDAVGMFVPGTSTLETVINLFRNDKKIREMTRIATTEYDRFLHLEDQFQDITTDLTWAAKVLSNSTNSMTNADNIVNQSMVLISHTIDTDKITSSLEIEVIKSLHAYNKKGE